MVFFFSGIDICVFWKSCLEKEGEKKCVNERQSLRDDIERHVYDGIIKDSGKLQINPIRYLKIMNSSEAFLFFASDKSIGKMKRRIFITISVFKGLGIGISSSTTGII